MAESTLPYVTAYGNVTKALERIQSASTPERFTQDFLATKLDMKGGSAKPVIPFMKRTGFLASDGGPTELYKRFRNPSHRGAAAAQALKSGYGALYEINEYVHDVGDSELKGIVVQATGAEDGSNMVKSVTGSFKALRAFADFDAAAAEPVAVDATAAPTESGAPTAISGLSLGYTINLHLPATSDVAVFNAIFRSLKEHLL